MKKIVSIMVTLVLLAISMTAIVSADADAVKKLSKADLTATGDGLTLSDDDKGIKANFVNGTIDHLIKANEKLKLDGLLIDITDVTNTESGNTNKAVNIAISKDGGAIDGASRIVFLVNNYGALVWANDSAEKAIESAVTAEGIKANGIILDSPRQGIYLYFTKNDDGSFTYYAAGALTSSGIISKEDIVKMFGAEDPSVHLTINNAYWGQTSTGSFIINEISTGTTNRFINYSDVNGRDLAVSQTGVLEGITLTHFGNQGAFAQLAKKVKFDGLTLEGLSFDHQAIIRFGSTPGTFNDNGFEGEGLMFQINADGNVYATFLDTPADEDLLDKFEKNQKYTIHTSKKADGSFVAFIIGEETGEKFKFAISADYIKAMYVDADPSVNISITAYSSEKVPDIKITKIDKITHKKFDVVAPDNVTATISERVLTAGIGTPDSTMTYGYQWFSNTKNANTAGTKIDGATAATYSIPVGLKAGTHYYYCVVTAESYSGKEEAVASNAVEFVVKADEKPPVETPTDTGDSRSIAIFAVAIFAALCVTTLVLIGKKKKA